MTDAGILERTELDESILDDDLLCAINNCDAHAEWASCCKMCKNGFHCCTRHRTDVETWFQDRQDKGMAILCRGCGAMARKWRDLIEFRPV